MLRIPSLSNLGVPTAAACRKNPSAAITPRDNGCYQYGSVFQTYTPPPER